MSSSMISSRSEGPFRSTFVQQNLWHLEMLGSLWRVTEKVIHRTNLHRSCYDYCCYYQLVPQILQHRENLLGFRTALSNCRFAVFLRMVTLRSTRPPNSQRYNVTIHPRVQYARPIPILQGRRSSPSESAAYS
jgi:hypothetical protein